MSVFFSSLKNCFWAISIARLSIEPLELLFSIDVITISIHQGSFCMLDRYSIASRSMEVTLLWTPLDNFSIAPSGLFNSRHLPIHRAAYVSIYRVSTIFSSFLLDLSRQFLSLHLPKLISLSLSLSLNLKPKSFSTSRSFLHLVWSYFLYSYHAFHDFLPNFLDFSKLMSFS